MTERQLQAIIFAQVGAKLLIWRQHAGKVRLWTGAWIAHAPPGAADIIGVLPDGRHLEIEVKSEHGRQSETQKNWQRAIEQRGGLYVLARSVADVWSAIERAGYVEASEGGGWRKTS